MAICRIIETGVTPEQYIQLVTQLGVGESNPPPGGTMHIAAEGDDGKMRIIDVWDSRAQADEWGEKVMAVRKTRDRQRWAITDHVLRGSPGRQRLALSAGTLP